LGFIFLFFFLCGLSDLITPVTSLTNWLGLFFFFLIEYILIGLHFFVFLSMWFIWSHNPGYEFDKLTRFIFWVLLNWIYIYIYILFIYLFHSILGWLRSKFHNIFSICFFVELSRSHEFSFFFWTFNIVFVENRTS
jgi:hypothetical protein